MRKLLFAAAIVGNLATVQVAHALDFLGSAASTAVLNAVAQQVTGLWVADSQDQNGNDVPAHIAPQGTGNALGGWAFTLFPNNGEWDVPTGATYTDAMGNQEPVMGPKDALIHFILRWNGDYTQIPFPLGTTVVTGTETINGQPVQTITITGPAGVTLTSPLPDNVPIRFE